MKSKNLFCFLLFVMIFSFVSTAFAAAKKFSAHDMADKLVAEGKIPMYVRDKGNFTYNPDFKIIGINGYNVNLRSQPNTKSNVVIQLSNDEPEKWPAYLGEWTHPNGEKWVVGESRVNGKLKTVWIFGQFAEPMTQKNYSSAKKSNNSNAKLSDSEYKQMMSNSDFANADKALNQAWRNAKNSLSKSSFEALKKSQTSWIKRGRDIEVKPLLAKMSRVEAYTSVTNARAEYINKFANGTTNLSSAEENYEDSGNIYDDVPDDLPDDLPDDVPSDSDVPNEDSSSKNSEARKNINLNSSDDAADFLYERLIELEKIEPNENLEYLSDVDINGKNCFEFSASFNFNETGRYAVSQNGDIYEYDGSNFVPVK